MSAAERKSKKIYYTMGEVSEMFDVNPSLIRFWEQKFDILKPDKNKKGNRLFTPADIENLKLIYHLVKENGMTLAGAQTHQTEPRGPRTRFGDCRQVAAYSRDAARSAAGVEGGG